MKSNRNLSILTIALIGLLIISDLCSATISVSVDSDKENYFVGDTIVFTADVAIRDESGDCVLDDAYLQITDGSSKTCTLPYEYGSHSSYGTCSVNATVEETHPDECLSYGGVDDFNYSITWTIPASWEADYYTSTMGVNLSASTKASGSASFYVLNSSSSNDDVEVTDQTTDETASGLAEADLTLENLAGTEQATIVSVPIPGTGNDVNLTLTVPASGTRYIVSLENGLICSPESAAISSADYSSSSKALTVDLSGGGEQEILVYVGGNGQPTSIKVEGVAVSSWTYDSDKKTVTFQAEINCPDEVVISWYVASTTTTIARVSSSGGGSGGGVAYTAKPKISCFDGIENCHDGACEDDIDCGGPCKPCPSCSDGVQNQGETGLDCGGPCPACKATTTTTVKSVTTTGAVTSTTLATKTTPTTTTTVARVKLTSTTTAGPTPGIPLGVTEGLIILLAIVLISLAFMIQTGRI